MNKLSIENYVFEDVDVDDINVLVFNKKSEIVEVNFYHGNALHLFKNDAIALAKHFKLTSDDL